jgi:hypothetical protein
MILAPASGCRQISGLCCKGVCHLTSHSQNNLVNGRATVPPQVSDNPEGVTWIAEGAMQVVRASRLQEHP